MKQFSPFFYKVTNLPKRNFLLLILISAIVQIGFAQTTTVIYSGLGTVTCPAAPVATISTPPTGITFSQFSRGSGVTCSSVTGGISGTTFNGSLPTNITGNKWYTYSISSDANSTFTLNSLNIVSKVSSATGSPSVSIQYRIGAGVLTNIGSFIPTVSTSTYTITPSTPISVGASQVLNIFIIPNNLNASTTTCRVENNTSASITRSGTETTTFQNVQSPNTTTTVGEGVTGPMYIRAYKMGLTEAAGQATGLLGWVGYSSTNDNPTNAGWTWLPATFNVQAGIDDEFQAEIGVGFPIGTYYFASRFQISGGPFTYGGAGGNWNNDNVQFIVNPNVVDFCNIQSPFSGTITAGDVYNVFGKVYKQFITEAPGGNVVMNAWIGKSTINNNPNNASWSWTPATYNTQIGTDDEYQANIGTGTTAGTYYYASRFQITGSTEFRYGGTGGLWNNDSGVLTVNGAAPVVTPANVSGTFGVFSTYNIIASNGPMSYAVVSGTLPPGVFLNTATGEISGPPNAAGTFTVGITATNSGGTSPAVTFNINIAKANQTITFTTVSSLVYGAAPLALTGTSSIGFAVNYASDNNLVGTISGSTFTATGIGTVNITASQSGNSDINSAVDVIRNIVVTPKPITISGLSANGKLQDGNTTTTLSGTATLVGVLASDIANVNLINTPIANFATANVGANIPVTISGYSLSGAAAANYSLSQPTDLTADIIALITPVATDATNILTTSFDANWNSQIDAYNGYVLDVSTSPTFRTTTPSNLTEGFLAGTVAPSGWTFTSVGGTYTTPGNFGVAFPSIQLNDTNDRVLTPVLDGNATQLSFWMKGNSTNATSGMLVEGFNGSTWVTIQNLIGFALAGTTYTYNSLTSPALPLNITQFRFTYTKTAGNIGFDDVNINYDLLTPSFIAGYNAFPIANQATLTANVTPIATNTIHYYRVRAVNGTAQSANSNTIVVAPASIGGTASSNQTICSGTTPVDLTLSGSFGSIVKWQSSTTLAFGMPTDIANTTTTLTSMMMGGLTATTYYRAVVQSGMNPQAFSSVVFITVNPNVIPTFTAVAPICSGVSLSALPTTSNNSITGTWAPALDNLNTTTYTFTPTSGQCALTTTLTINVGVTKTWNAGWTPLGAPTSLDTVLINASYTASADGGTINGCTMIVDNNAVVLIDNNSNIILQGKLTVLSGSVTINNNANLIQSQDIANTGNITVKRNSSNLFRLDYSLWSSPVVGTQTLLNFSPLTTQASAGPPVVASRFYVYNALTNTYNNSFNPATTTFASGKGYLIRMPNNWSTAVASPYLGSFTGVPTNGNHNFTLANGGVGLRFNAIGNPYPSDVSITDFVAANTNNITGTLYFWRKTNSTVSSPGYCTWAGGTFTSNLEPQVFDPNGIISVGQGFIVEAKNSATSVDFNNTMRVANNINQFFRNTNTIEYNRIWLNVSGNDSVLLSAKSQMAVGYITDATQGEDAFDGKFFNNGDVALTTLIGTDKYAIQGRALPFNDNDIVPMSFKATTAGNYNIAIDHVDGLFTGNSEIYLRDNLTGTTNNLTTGAYNFATLAGDFDARFELIYRSGILANNNPFFNQNSVMVYKNNAGININSGSNAITNVKIFDIQGRLLIEKTNLNTNQTIIDSNAFANQLLIVEITSTNNMKTFKKIIN